MLKKSLAVLSAALLLGSTVLPAAAQNYDNRDGRYDDRGYDDNDRGADNDRGTYDNGYNEGYRDAQANHRAPQDVQTADCARQQDQHQAGGLIIGAIAGGLLGSTIMHGPARGGGTVVGAILGGALGAKIGHDISCEDQTYVQRANYDGFERGRAHSHYAWRNDRSGNYGSLDVGDYYNDGPRRCATYTQQIYVHGHPETARGHACRQPDGGWTMID